MRLPKEFLQRMEERLGEEFPAFLRIYEEDGGSPAKGLRINTLKISAEEFERLSPFPLGDSVFGDPVCRYIEAEKPGADVCHFAGLYYLQEPSAMIVGEFAKECGRKERVLDLCAAPGGKTTCLAAQMAGKGILVANEIDYKRAQILGENVARMGITNCAVTNSAPAKFAASFPEFFDLVLVDAPCSGEGMFRKEENAIPEWSEKNVARCAARQRDILGAAAETVAGGGHLIYSTCTFAEEEDEWQIEAFLTDHPEFKLIKEKKLYPHLFRGEGHYCALLQKTEGERGNMRPYAFMRKEDAERAYREFAADFFTEPPEGPVTARADGKLFLVPKGLVSLSGVADLRPGVELGTWDGKTFRPAYALAMAYGDRAKRKVIADREEAIKYLKGGTLCAEIENGWCVVTLGRFPLGIGKCVDTVVKNHYPKGMRLVKSV